MKCDKCGKELVLCRECAGVKRKYTPRKGLKKAQKRWADNKKKRLEDRRELKRKFLALREETKE